MSGAKSFRVGQSVFTRDGQKHYIREMLADDKVLASPFLSFEDYDGSQEYPADTASVKIARELFPVAPTNVIAADVTSARAELAAVREEINAARDALRDANRERLSQLEVINKQPSLARLVDFLEGKITHFVVEEYQGSCSIKTWKEFAVFIEDRRERGLKLLSLFGTPWKGVEWWMNTYRDGSGTNTKCQPCTSEEEALATVREWIGAAWADFNPERAWCVSGAVKAADNYGVPVPDHIREKLASDAVAASEKAVAKAEDDLAKARAALSAARGEA
jgi:hypothetical protein